MKTFDPTTPAILTAVAFEDPYGDGAAHRHPDHEPPRGLFSRVRQGVSLLYGSISLCCFVSGLVALSVGVSTPVVIRGTLKKVKAALTDHRKVSWREAQGALGKPLP